MKKFFFILWLFLITPLALCDGRLVVDGFVPDASNVGKSPSNTADNRRLFTIYLPEQYDTSTTERFPVVYYLPGLGGDHTSFTLGNEIILDELMCNGTIVPFLVVHVDPSLVDGIDPADGRRKYQGSWYVNSTLNGNFQDYIINELIPYVDANYRTKTDKAFRGIMGQSMGGYGAMFLGTTRADTFVGFGSASGSPLWVDVTDILSPAGAPSPGDVMYTLNSLIIPEIPTTGPNAGKVTPDNGTFSFTLFSRAAAMSPNTSNPPYYVDLPFEAASDGTPVFEAGTFPGANPDDGSAVSFSMSLKPRNDVITRWLAKDPYSLALTNLATLAKQAIYLDGGNTELINAAGIKTLSDRYIANNIDHEYILYNGGHTTCLTTEDCSRHFTMFKMFSAKFAENNVCADTVRTKLVGVATITLEDNATMEINSGTILGIETSPASAITATNITINVQDSAQINIGSNTTAGGALQVGNNFSKAQTENDATLNTHTVACQIVINGTNAHLEVGQQGFLGLGVGIVGKNPSSPDNWSVNALTNVTNISLDIQNGAFVHNKIASGNSSLASLLAFGPSTSYTINVNNPTGIIRGGGNMACLSDSTLLQPVILTTPGTITAGGIRNNLDTDANAMDYFYNKPMGSEVFYTNDYTANLLSSSELLDDRGTMNPFTITTNSLTTLCKFLNTENYLQEASKEANISDNNNVICLSYHDNNQLTRLEEPSIPIGSTQNINLETIANNSGAVGVQIETVNGQRKIITVYDLNPA